MIYIACVWSHAELETVRELRHNGFDAYCPCETLDRLIMGRKRRFRRPAFPGYVFVSCDADRLSEIHAVEAVYAFVQGVTSSGERKPAAIHAEALQPVFLAELFGALDFTRQPDQWKPGLGERVRVKAGRWQVLEYIGKIVRLSSKEAWIEPDKGGMLRVRIEELEAAA